MNGLQVSGVIVSNRDTGKAYALHEECKDSLYGLLGDDATDPFTGSWFVVGPTTGEFECNLTGCNKGSE